MQQIMYKINEKTYNDKNEQIFKNKFIKIFSNVSILHIIVKMLLQIS